MLKEQYQKAIEKEVASYRKAYDKIMNSEDPRLAGDDVKQYEAGKLKDALESKVAELESDFNVQIDAQIEAQERAAARSTFVTSAEDKRLADEFISELIAEAKFAYTDGDKLEAVRKFESKLEYFDEGGLYYVKKRLPDVASAVQGDDYMTKQLRGIHRTFSELKTPEQQLLGELRDAKLSGVSHKYRTLRLTHPSYASFQKARRSSHTQM